MYSWIYLCVLLINFELCLGRYDLYMNATETEKLLGHNAEFYFVKDGAIKSNAIQYHMDLPTHVNCLAFTWYAPNLEVLLIELSNTYINPNYQQCLFSHVIYFSFDVKLNETGIVKMDYTAEGKIPFEKQDFCLYVKCTNEVEGVVVIDIRLKIFENSAINKTTLHFTRTKSCKDLISPIITDVIGEPESKARNIMKKYISIAVAFSVIFITAVAVGVIHVHSIPKPNKESERLPPRPPVLPPRRPMGPSITPNSRSINLTVPILRHTYLPPERLAPVGCPPAIGCPPVVGAPVGSVPVMVPIREAIAFLSNPVETSTIGNQIPQDPLHPEDIVPLREKRNKEIRLKLQDIVLDRSRVSMGDVIQEGTFGKIYEGVVTGPEDGEVQDVFVKTVSEKASDEQASLLLAEGSMLKGLNHQNICSIVYVCISEDDVDRPLVLTPIMNQGNLKSFIKKSRTPEGTGLEKSVTTRDLIDMALQIANGMLYLEMRNLVHKDLATRNCMIDDEFHVKISDCSLSRDLFPMDYHCLGDNENKPVKWMSVESLEQHRFTTASDVWSYGITLWELITLGQQPYASIDAFEMAFHLKNGHRLGQPTGCPDDLFTIMGYCWALSGEERPGFARLIILLTKFFNALIQFI